MNDDDNSAEKFCEIYTKFYTYFNKNLRIEAINLWPFKFTKCSFANSNMNSEAQFLGSNADIRNRVHIHWNESFRNLELEFFVRYSRSDYISSYSRPSKRLYGCRHRKKSCQRETPFSDILYEDELLKDLTLESELMEVISG